MNSLLQGALERIAREVGSFLANSICSGVSSAFLTLWTWLLVRYPGLIPDATLEPPDQAKSKSVIKALANQFFDAALVLMAMSFVFALLWLCLVRFHRPASPVQAVKFRRYWLMIAAVLLVCTATFYGFAVSGTIGFPLFKKMAAFPMFLLLAALILSALISFYLPSALRSPPTVIAAIPFGSYVARLRFRQAVS